MHTRNSKMNLASHTWRRCEEIRKQGGNLNIPLYIVATEPADSECNAPTNGNAVRESLFGVAKFVCLKSAMRCMRSRN